MHNRILWTAVAASLFVIAPAGRTQSPPATVAPMEYTLMRITIAETKPAERVWILKADRAQEQEINTAFKTLDSPAMHDCIANLPSGTIINYLGSSLPLIARHFENSKDDVPAFAAFCQSKKIQFSQGPVL